MTGNLNAHKPKWANKDKPKNSTFSTFTDDKNDKKTGQDCPLKDCKHPLWKCEKFLKMKFQLRYEISMELKLCFCCLTGKHVVKDSHSKRVESKDVTGGTIDCHIAKQMDGQKKVDRNILRKMQRQTVHFAC